MTTITLVKHHFKRTISVSKVCFIYTPMGDYFSAMVRQCNHPLEHGTDSVMRKIYCYFFWVAFVPICTCMLTIHRTIYFHLLTFVVCIYKT